MKLVNKSGKFRVMSESELEMTRLLLPITIKQLVDVTDGLPENVKMYVSGAFCDKHAMIGMCPVRQVMLLGSRIELTTHYQGSYGTIDQDISVFRRLLLEGYGDCLIASVKNDQTGVSHELASLRVDDGFIDFGVMPHGDTVVEKLKNSIDTAVMQEIAAAVYSANVKST